MSSMPHCKEHEWSVPAFHPQVDDIALKRCRRCGRMRWSQLGPWHKATKRMDEQRDIEGIDWHWPEEEEG